MCTTKYVVKNRYCVQLKVIIMTTERWKKCKSNSDSKYNITKSHVVGGFLGIDFIKSSKQSLRVTCLDLTAAKGATEKNPWV